MKLQLNYNNGTQEIFYKAGEVLTPASDLSSYPAEGLTAIIANDRNDPLTDINSISTYVDDYGETKQVGVPGFNRFTDLKLVKFLNLGMLTESMFENSTVESVILPDCHAFVDTGYTMELSGGSHFRNSALKSLFIPFLDSQPAIENPTVFEGCSGLKEVVANFQFYDSGAYYFSILGVPDDARFTSPDRAHQNNLCAYWDCITLCAEQYTEQYLVNYPKQCLTDPCTLYAGDIEKILQYGAAYQSGINAIYDSLCATTENGITALGYRALYNLGLSTIAMPFVSELSDEALAENPLCIDNNIFHPFGGRIQPFGQLRNIGHAAFAADQAHTATITIDLNCFNEHISQLTSVGSNCFTYVNFINDSALNMGSVVDLGPSAFNTCMFERMMDINLCSLTSIYDNTFVGTHLSAKRIYLNNIWDIENANRDSRLNLFETVSVYIDDYDHDGVFVDGVRNLRTMRQFAQWNSTWGYTDPIRNVIVSYDGRTVAAYAANIGSIPDPRALRTRLAWTPDDDANLLRQFSFNVYPFGDLSCLALPNLHDMQNIDTYLLKTLDFSYRTDSLTPQIDGFNVDRDHLTVYVPDTLYGKFTHADVWCNLSSCMKSSIPVNFKATVYGQLDTDWYPGVVTDSIDTLMDQVMAAYDDRITELSFCSMEGHERDPYNRIVAPLSGYSYYWDCITDIYFSEQGVDRDPYIASGSDIPSHMFGYFSNPVTVHVKGDENGNLKLHNYYFQYVLPQSDAALVIDWPYLNGKIDGLYFGDGDYNPLSNLIRISAHKCVSINDLRIYSSVSRLTDLEIPFVKTINGTWLYGPPISSLFIAGVPDMNLYFTESISNSFIDYCQIQSLNCRNLTSVTGDDILVYGMSSVTDLNFPMLTNTDASIVRDCKNLSCIWTPVVTESPMLQGTKISTFRNYADGFHFTLSSFADVYLDAGDSDSDSFQIRGVPISALEPDAKLSLAKYEYGYHHIIGHEWPGDMIYNVIDGYIGQQIPSSPNHRPWMHLCLADDAQSYLSGLFLNCGNDSRLANEYNVYVRNHEFQHASSRHDYSPKYDYSLYDLIDYSKMLRCDLWWFAR